MKGWRTDHKSPVNRLKSDSTNRCFKNYRQQQEDESRGSQDKDLFAPAALRTQPSVTRPHEVSPYDET